MELHDLKNDWLSAGMQTEKQPILSAELIGLITRKKYNSRISKLKYSEWAGGIVCIAGLVFVAFNFSKLDTLFFEATGVITMLLLIVLPAISLSSLTQFYLIKNPGKTYADAIKVFALRKLRFLKLQRINAAFTYLLLVAVIILLPKFFGKKAIADNGYFWTFAFSFGYIFLIFFSKWVKKVYSNTLKQAEELLKEVGA